MFGVCLLVLRVFLFLVNPEITPRGEQRDTLKFLTKSGCTPIQCWRQLHDVWGDRMMSKTQVRVWHKRFLSGSDTVADLPRSGRPRSVRTQDNVDMIRGMIDGDGSLSITEMAHRTGLSHPIVRRIVRDDFKLSRKCAKFVPRELTESQKWVRKTVCDNNIKFLCSQDDPDDFIKRVVTGDETWVSTYEAEGKLASTVWGLKGGPRPKKPRQLWSQTKCMLTLFFDWQGVILVEFLGCREKITKERYVVTLGKLKEAICKKRLDLWKERNFWLHHDNASPHTADLTVGKLHQWGIQILPHPAYSPDCAPCDFKLFPAMKKVLRGQRFPNIDALQKETRRVLKEELDPSIYSDAMHKMVTRWQKCSTANGEYFEGDNIEINPLFERLDSSMDSSSDD